MFQFPYSFWSQFTNFSPAGTSLIPFMTSNTQPYGTVTAAGLNSGQAFYTLSSSGSPYGVYDSWNYNATNQLTYQFTGIVSATGWSFYGSSNGGTVSLQVSDDNINWTGVDTEIVFSSNTRYTFGRTTGLYWRLNMTYVFNTYYWGLYG